MAYMEPTDVEPDRKCYGDVPDASIFAMLPAVGDPMIDVDSQNNDEYYVYDTDAAGAFGSNYA